MNDDRPSVPAGPPGLPPLICPDCGAPLSLGGPPYRPAACARCPSAFPLLPSGHFQLLPRAAEGFRDWWRDDERKRAFFLEEAVAREEAGERRLARDFLLPLLARLAARQRAPLGRVLSVGCGSGEDVEVLAAAGLEVCGVDSGGRTALWETRRRPAERFFVADALRLPFADASFDFAYSLGVIEHVGTLGDTMSLAADAAARRAAFARCLARVVRPGGWILVTCPNRLFPVDFAHGGGRRGLRLHGPGDRFLLSFGDVRRLFVAGAGCRAARPLPPRGALDPRPAARGRGPLLRGAILLFGLYLRLLPRPLYTSPLNPVVVALVER